MRGNNKIGKDNPDQLNFVEEVTKELQNKREQGRSYNGKCYMLDGPGGNGKTFCLDTIYSYCNMKENDFLCLCSAFSGKFYFLSSKIIKNSLRGCCTVITRGYDNS